jgi:hypothetical protein
MWYTNPYCGPLGYEAFVLWVSIYQTTRYRNLEDPRHAYHKNFIIVHSRKMSYLDSGKYVILPFMNIYFSSFTAQTERYLRWTPK